MPLDKFMEIGDDFNDFQSNFPHFLNLFNTHIIVTPQFLFQQRTNQLLQCSVGRYDHIISNHLFIDARVKTVKTLLYLVNDINELFVVYFGRVGIEVLNAEQLQLSGRSLCQLF